MKVFIIFKLSVFHPNAASKGASFIDLL